jgi:hypothetical protein
MSGEAGSAGCRALDPMGWSYVVLSAVLVVSALARVASMLVESIRSSPLNDNDEVMCSNVVTIRSAFRV